MKRSLQAWLFGALLILLSCVPSHGQAVAQRSFTTNIVAPDSGVSLTTTTVGSHKIYWRVVGTVSSCTVALDSSGDGSTWSAGGVIAGQTCTTNGSSAVTAANVNNVRINVTAFSGTGSVIITYAGETDLPVGTSTSSNFPASVSTGNGTTDASTLRVTVSSDSTGQIKATNLPTTVDTNSGAAGASTIRVITATNSPVQLSAGTAIVGKVGIDQTTPGTTNAVQTTNLPSTVSTGNGATSASTVRVTLATDSAGPVFVSNLPSTVDTNSGLKSASTIRVVLATDQPQLTNKLLVTPDSVALPANQSVNAAQVGGTNTDTNSGVKSAGTLRVVLATDQPQLTNKLLVTPDSVALPANQSVNVAQMNGVTTSMGSGTSDTGTQRIIQAQTTPTDGTSNTSVPGPQNFNMLFDNSTQQWNRFRNISGAPGLTAVGFVGSGTAADAFSNASVQPWLNHLGNQTIPQVGNTIFNGVSWDRVRTAALANEAPSSGAFTVIAGLQMVEKGPRWVVSNVSSSGAQATASKAAVASVRHVVDCIAYSADSAAAITAANTVLNIRDGATGAGTIIWSYSVSFPTATGLGLQEVTPQHICGLNLIGTTNTAMTIEFAAAVTGAIQNVNMSGYDIN